MIGSATIRATVSPIAVIVLAIGCTKLPTSPTALAPGDLPTAQAVMGGTPNPTLCSEAMVWFDDTTPSRVEVQNLSTCAHTYTLIVWQYHSEWDQSEVARHGVRLEPGEFAELNVGLPEHCGITYQRDVYMDLPVIPATQRYSLLDALNHTFWAAGHLLTIPGCAGPPMPVVNPVTPPVVPPPNLPPPVVPPLSSGSHACERASFAEVTDLVVSGGRASITLRLAPGYDNVVVYLLAYSSPQVFPVVGGRTQPLFPQTLVQQLTFTLNAGPAQTIAIDVPTVGTGWQVDAGCLPGPAILNGRQDYPASAFLEAAVGNR
jgi:hypothetical protein